MANYQTTLDCSVSELADYIKNAKNSMGHHYFGGNSELSNELQTKAGDTDVVVLTYEKTFGRFISFISIVLISNNKNCTTVIAQAGGMFGKEKIIKLFKDLIQKKGE